MNRNEHPCPDCRYPRRIDEDFCPNCPFNKLNEGQQKNRWSALFDFGNSEKKQAAPEDNPFPQLPIQQNTPLPVNPPINNQDIPQSYNKAPEPPSYIPPTPPTPSQNNRRTIGPGSEMPPLPKTQPRGTFNPYTEPLRPDPKFKLTSIPRHTETSGKTSEFEGKSVTLNRNNLDRENFTISGQEHAVIENVDGRWFINNKSSLKTTYIQVNSMMELKDGDIILLGDRMFIFRPE